MEEQATWRGHSFTLLVFVGIVTLCSIFFVLGMLVGRSQGQKFATVAAAEAAAKAAAVRVPAEGKPELTFYDSVEDTPPAPAPDPAPEMPDAAPEKAAPSAPEPPPTPVADAGPVINFQIGALRNAADAEKLLAQAKRNGFKGFILAPPRGDKNPFYRVHVGPYSDPGKAELDRQKLVSLKYQPIKK